MKNILQVLKYHSFQFKLAKLIEKKEKKIHDKNMKKEFITTKPVLQRILKRILWTEDHNEELS